MTKNRLSDLNDHLFAQIERLADEDLTPEQIDQEVKRGYTIIAAADQILRHATLKMQAAKMMTDYDGRDPTHMLKGLVDADAVPKVVPGRTLVAVHK